MFPSVIGVHARKCHASMFTRSFVMNELEGLLMRLRTRIDTELRSKYHLPGIEIASKELYRE
jgi:hypothetical protein